MNTNLKTPEMFKVLQEAAKEVGCTVAIEGREYVLAMDGKVLAQNSAAEHIWAKIDIIKVAERFS